MDVDKKFEYNVHASNTDEYGDPLIGISRNEFRASGLLIPRPLVDLRLTDLPKPVRVEGLVMPTRNEMRELLGDAFQDSNVISFVDYYGVGEQADIDHISDTVVGFVTLAIKNARNYDIHARTHLLPSELEVVQLAIRTAHRAQMESDDSSRSDLKTGMYL